MRLVNGDKLAEILEQWRDALNALLNSLPPNEPLTSKGDENSEQ